MALPDAAAAYYLAQQRTSLSTVLLARRLWARLGPGDFDQAWKSLGPSLMVAVSAGQTAAVAQAAAYVPAVLDELNISADAVAELVPSSLVGVASDGRDLASLLYQPIIEARTMLGQGGSLVGSLRSGGAHLDRIVSTQVVDAGRAAESVTTAVTTAVTGWCRVLVLPSCDRCAVLAGRFYRWNTGFQRHPGCDCRHVPATRSVARDLTTDTLGAIKAGQVKGLSAADFRAIAEDGADPGKVINAKRGMQTEQGLLGAVKSTPEGTGRSRRRKVAPVRLRPETIYKMSDDRDHAVRLLKKYGYVL